MDDFQNILLIKPSSLGDVVHTLPVLNLLRIQFPNAKITWLLSRACAGLLDGHPKLDEILLFERKKLGMWWKNPGALWDLDRDLRRRKFDLVIDLQGLFRSGWMSMRTGAKKRVGFANAREGAWLFYTHKVNLPTPEMHAVDRYLAVAQSLGCGITPVEFPFHSTTQDLSAVDQLLAPLNTPNFAVLLPGANWETKRWPAEYFASLARELEKWSLKTVVCGGADVEKAAHLIHPTLNLTNKTTLRQLVVLLSRARLVIANDSGPMHIASALGVPLLAIFGPTNPVRTGPYGRLDCVVRHEIDCWPCYGKKCSHLSCLNHLTVQNVLAAAKKTMNL
jgi:heptosyltransferase I